MLSSLSLESRAVCEIASAGKAVQACRLRSRLRPFGFAGTRALRASSVDGGYHSNRMARFLRRLGGGRVQSGGFPERPLFEEPADHEDEHRHGYGDEERRGHGPGKGVFDEAAE